MTTPAERIASKFGGQTALAVALSIRQSTVSYWMKTGFIPEKRRDAVVSAATERNIAISPLDFMGESVFNPTVVADKVVGPQSDSKDQTKFPSVDAPPSPFAKFKGTIELGGDPVDCYVLDTGERVISLRSTIKAMAEVDAGNLGEYIGAKALNPFIDKDFILGELRDFHIPGTQFRGKGLTSEHFELICRGYVRALYEPESRKALTERQTEIAIKCAVITAGLTRTGLDALIDEATGYQYERAQDALQVKFRAFIAEELRDWEKTFPDELWEEFGRLTKWKGSLHARPKWWGKLVIELIYDTLDPDVAEFLKDNKPLPGIRWHRQLTENYGVRQLVSRCYEVIGVSKTCSDIRELRDRVAEHYGREPVQLTLYLPKRKD